MSRFSKLIMIAALAVVVAGCSRTARIDGSVHGAESSELIVKLLDVNKYKILDTVSTDAVGRFSYKVRIEKGQPEFVYVFHSDKKLASLLLHTGDKVKMSVDSLGSVLVEGSEESSKLMAVEKDFADAKSSMMALSRSLSEASEADAPAIRSQLSQSYLTYYRDRVGYIMENSRSMTVVPVLFQFLTETLPVFGQMTDAIHFANAADSLEVIYPDSKYVKALRAEAENRLSQMELASRLSAAEEVDFFDVELPDNSGKRVKLSDVHDKLTLLYFWTAEDASQKMFNLDVLMPVYQKYHDQGFKIYQVSLDVDNGLWARVVKEQGLPWTNVSDISGSASRYISIYNLSKLPAAFFIGGKGLSSAAIKDAESLSALVSERLK